MHQVLRRTTQVELELYARLAMMYWAMLFDRQYRKRVARLKIKRPQGARRARFSGVSEDAILEVVLQRAKQTYADLVGREAATSRHLTIGMLALMYEVASNEQRAAWFKATHREDYENRLAKWTEYAGQPGIDPLSNHVRHVMEQFFRVDRIVGQP